MDHAIVSIIVPIYNAEGYLERCIYSCTNQSYHHIELILVNDGSTDDSLSICKKCLRIDKRVVLIDKKNEGVSKTRNLGIENAKGEFIVFVDADDWIEYDLIEKLLKKQEESDYDLVVCGNRKKLGQRTKKEVTTSDSDIMSHDEVLRYLATKKDDYLFRGPVNKLYRSSIIKQNSIIFCQALSLGEDVLFNYGYLAHVGSIGFIPGYVGYNVFVINNSDKSKRYFRSAKYLFESRFMIINGFVDLYRSCDKEREYYGLIIRKVIHELSVLENLAVCAKFSYKEIKGQNITIGNNIALANVRLASIQNMRDKFTCLCYKYHLFLCLFLPYKFFSLLK